MMTFSYDELNIFTWVGHQMLVLLLICHSVERLYSFRYRILQKNMQILLCGICGQVIMMLLVSMLSFFLPENSPAMPWLRSVLLSLELFASVCCLLVMSMLGNLKTEKKKKIIRFVGLVLTYALILLILTNHLHHLLYDCATDRRGVYLYNTHIGYYLVALIIVSCSFAAVAVLCIRAIRNLNFYGVLWLGLFISLSILYIVTRQVYRFSDAVKPEYLYWPYDRGLFVSALMLIYVNLAVSSGLILSNKNYVDLFEQSNLKIFITDKELDICHKSIEIGVVDKEVLARIVENMPNAYPLTADRMVYAREMPDGYVFYVHDVRELNELHREAEETLKRNRRINELLAIENTKKRSDAKDKISMDLIDGLSRHIQYKTDKLNEMIRRLNELGTEPEDEKERWQLWARSTFCLTDIKRHCIFFFLGRQDPYMPAEELAVYLDEMAEFAGYANIRCFLTNKVSGQIRVNFAAFCYDFFTCVINQAAMCRNAILIEELTMRPEKIEMHIMTSFDIENLDFFRGEVVEGVIKYGGKISFRQLDDVVDISLLIPQEERRP